ncbi:hypothetical protein B0H10DRAFT_2028332 [Mycena sp. CBHHK59/15]|nr:hypothetical protein B0H10DRAFT_2028332 [Mycena sp. CBHHK59/15]
MDSLASLPAEGTPGSFEKLIRNLIQESESNILDIDAKIARLNSQIRDLGCLRELEREKIASLRGAIAPIRKLPIELLTHIFLLSVVEKDIPDSRRNVHRICQVSPYWRQLAHSTPQLWTTPLRLRPFTRPNEDYLASTQTWVDRSYPLPIPIHVSSVLSEDEILPLMGVLLSAAKRWRTLNTAFESVASFIHLPPDTFPSLEELVLRAQDENSDRFDIPAFGNAPRLRSVTLCLRNGWVSIPWHQLTELNVTEDSPIRCNEILLACENIVTSTFHTRAWPTTVQAPSPQKTLPFLKNLVLSFGAHGNGGHLAPIFETFNLPALHKFDLMMDTAIPWPAVSFTQFQRRSPNIHSIKLSSYRLDSTQLTDILRHAPALTELGLTCAHAIDEALLGVLRYRDSDPYPLVPRLTVLAVGGAAEAPAGLLRMIRSRWWSDAQLQAHPIPPRVARLKRVRAPLEYVSFSMRYSMRDCINQGLCFDTW